MDEATRVRGPVTEEELERLLHDQFGHEAFRFGQGRVIRALLNRHDVLAVLPTGAGKSLVFQMVSQLLPGLTVVVSPLIALMKDQAESAQESGLEVAAIHSGMPAARQREALERALHGQSRLLYLSPERFQSPGFLESLKSADVRLFAVDEAHCISEWGTDFRPAYLELGPVAASLGRPPILALTATATPWVRDDIVQHLGMRRPEIVMRSVDRPNLFLEVRRILTEQEEFILLKRLLTGDTEGYPEQTAGPLAEAMQGSGIIYTATTRGARETALWLKELGITADFYHGKREKADRSRVQEAFMSGEIRVIAATNAFGLGVDKPDIRFVIHRDVPSSVEGYYQEAGRAGRDGGFARCVLVYREAALGRAAFLSSGGRVIVEDLAAVKAALMGSVGLNLSQLAERSGRGRTRTALSVHLLERRGIVRNRGGRVRLLDPEFDPAAVSLEGEDRRQSYEHSRLEVMRSYAELRDCRRRFLLNYFGQDPGQDRCFMCDNDVPREAYRVTPPSVSAFEGEEAVMEEILGDSDVPERADAAGPFHVGQPVVHASFGPGLVQRVTSDSITILFEQTGYKILDTTAVLAAGLLEAA